MGVSHLISIVGAGPGDPGLLTVKALDRLNNADVVLYDGVLGSEILELAGSDSIKIYVGKFCKDGQNQEKRQKEIHALFLFWAKQNKRVVRLKTGDPMIFGRGAEEIRFCKENKLTYEVIPGITAGIAGSSLLEIPLTERRKSGMTLFYTGNRVNGIFTDLEAIALVLKAGSTVVIYMGLHNLADLSGALQNKGVDISTSVNILCKISQPGQTTFETSIGEIPYFMKHNNPETPSVVIMGKFACKI
jgi:uroporphyrin-III C-methyltransferase